jgi:hypothetical protein
MPRNRKVSGVFLMLPCIRRNAPVEHSVGVNKKNGYIFMRLSEALGGLFFVCRLYQTEPSGAKTVPKKKLQRIFAIPWSFFLPSFNLFYLFCTFWITVVLQLKLYRFNYFLSGFIV